MTKLHPIIANWYHYCPKCKSELKQEARAAICPNCGFDYYVNPAPTVTVVVVNNEGKILVAKRGINPKKGFLDVPGGFIEPNETPEEAALREMREEISADVKLVAQLGPGFPDIYSDKHDPTLNFLFLAKLESNTTNPSDDVVDIQWMRAEDIPLDRLAFDNARESIIRYQQYRKDHHE